MLGGEKPLTFSFTEASHVTENAAFTLLFHSRHQWEFAWRLFANGEFHAG
jgi:hypothetical protein